MPDVLQGLTAGDLITGGGTYRVAWARDPVRIAAAETATLGWIDTTQGTLAAKLDAALAGTGFYRASPLAWSPDTITWDLVATTNQPTTGTTASQAVDRLNHASAFLSVVAFGPRARVAGEANRERQRATTDRVAATAADASNPFHNLWNGLKAFGLTTAIIAAGGLAVYAYLLTRKAKA